MSRTVRLLACLVVVVALAACRRESSGTPAPAPRQPTPAPTTADAAAAAPAAPKDVLERDPRYIIGISYPEGIGRHPGLARLLAGYADAARVELMQAVAGAPATAGAAPYELSLQFTRLAETPRLVAVAADGMTYTGGAHSNPLVARFVWLVPEQTRLTSRRLVPDAKAWVPIAEVVREQLRTALSARLDADGDDAPDRGRRLHDGIRMIEEGTAPDPRNYAQFEPLLDGDGRIRALRFVFPPYQVAPYSEGVQTADVPADVLRPAVAPGLRSLFAGG